MKEFNLRDRQALIVTVMLIFAAAYPLSRRYLDRNGPPCHPVITTCRSEGILLFSQTSKREVYAKCIRPALEGGTLGEAEIPAEIIEGCRRYVQRMRGD